MSTLELSTCIRAPIGPCFDLSRSVEVHLQSTAQTQETVVAGRASGLCELGDTITWRARHFGIFQRLTVTITCLERPVHFQDRMVRGAFKYFTHDHYFEERDGATYMRDVFTYAAPFGIIGRLSEAVLLDGYMRRLLERRNELIKKLAETR